MKGRGLLLLDTHLESKVIYSVRVLFYFISCSLSVSDSWSS